MSTMKWVALVNRQALCVHKLLCLCDKLSFECTSERIDPCGKIINRAVVGPTGGQTTCLCHCWKWWRGLTLTSHCERLSQMHELGSLLGGAEPVCAAWLPSAYLVLSFSLPSTHVSWACLGMTVGMHSHAMRSNEKWRWLYFIFRDILGRLTLPLSLLFSFMVFLTLSAPCSFSPWCIFSLAGSCYVVQQSFKLAILPLQSPVYSDCWCTVHHSVAGLSEGFVVSSLCDFCFN